MHHSHRAPAGSSNDAVFYCAIIATTIGILGVCGYLMSRVSRPLYISNGVESVDATSHLTTGSLHEVKKGRVKDGFSKGEMCVTKVPQRLNDPFLFGTLSYHCDRRAANFAADVVFWFNELKRFEQRILVNIPEVLGVTMLAERYLEGCTKFNSNIGWTMTPTNGWTMTPTNGSALVRVIDAMQALSHFSYHHSRGAKLLCDLQGTHKDKVMITAPAVMTNTKSGTSKFGPSDLGRRGIEQFFAHHKCNQFCDPKWIKPSNTCEGCRAVKGTVRRGRYNNWVVGIRDGDPIALH